MSESLTRLEELLADQATQGLTADEARELDALLQAEGVDADAWSDVELAAGALAASEPATPAMPAALRERILAQAPHTLPAPAEQPQTPAPAVTAQAPKPVASVNPVLAFLGGAVAAAAAIFIMVAVRTTPTTALPTPEQLAAEAGTIEPAWTVFHTGYEQVSGKVLWNNDQQAGYMVLTGLPANDPAQKQYQLWIVDPARDEAPVDGGVFDVPANAAGQVVVPINAKLKIIDPAAFAITLEQPGGVVKSAGPLLVTAMVEPQA